MKLIESLREIENSFTTVKKVSKKEITKTELSESLFKAANQVDKRNYRTAFDLTNGYQKALEEAIEKINPDKRWFEVTNCDIRTTLLENHNNIEATIRRILNESDSAEEVEDEVDDIEKRNDDDAEELTEETIGSDLSEYQKWVDYDMKHYGKVSSNTFRKITEAGLSLVKDQYGDYEVIADREDFAGIPYKKESLKENSKNTLTIKVSDIDYDISEEDLFGDETVEEIKASIPTEFTFNIRRDDWENFDHDELLADCIGDETGWLVNNFNYEILDESICEDTVKQGSQWVNKGKEGTHGKFKTKKEADAQRRAMFASGYEAEALKESQHPDLSEKNHTLAHALKRTWNDWANAKTREEAVNILVKAIKDEGLDTPATKKFLAHIKNQPLNAIIKTATNYTMAGMGDQYKVFNPSKKKGESLTEDDKDEEAYKKLKAGYSLADALK